VSAGRRWILIVVGLLAGNVIAVIALIAAAGPATADRIVPDYYARAARFDEQIVEDTASAALGWRVEVAFASGGLEVRVRSAAGAPVAGARVEVTGYHRAHAAQTIALVPVEVAPGVYRTPFAAAAGWWDVTVRSSLDHDRHVARFAVEAR
jgi:nitrogen fixation protein FixH